jgi:hypothetical protein
MAAAIMRRCRKTCTLRLGRRPNGEFVFNLQQLGEQLQRAVEAAIPGVALDLDAATDAVAISFVHPGHEATCILVLEPDAAVGVALLCAVIVGPWEEAAAADGGVSLFSLNPRLMTCSIGLLPINEDEVAVVLCRRMPAEAVEPSEAVALLNDMIWEYAQLTGGSEPAAAAAPVDRGPRLIHSLDEV